MEVRLYTFWLTTNIALSTACTMYATINIPTKKTVAKAVCSELEHFIERNNMKLDFYVTACLPFAAN